MYSYSAKNDVVFKSLFVRNPKLLKSLVSSLLDIPVEKIQNMVIMNPELPPLSDYYKFSRLDLLLDIGTEQINIEMQVNLEKDYPKRALFYWAKRYSFDLKKGEGYGRLKRTVSIHILDHVMYPEYREYHHKVVAMLEGKDRVFSEDMEMHFFELPKVYGRPDGGNMRELWLKFIKANGKEEIESMKSARVQEIDEACAALEAVYADDELREAIRLREKQSHDEASALGAAREEGIGIGREEGREEERQRNAEYLRSQGVSEDIIRNMLANN